MTVQSVSTRRRAKVSQQVRDQIVLDHLPLVKCIAIRVHENLPVHVDLDDLIHAGVMGLFDAVTKYDGAKNVVFHAYAKHRIKGAILDSLRQLDWASRDLRKRQKKVDATVRELSTKLGRTPSDTEVAQELGVGMERWRRMQMEMRTVARSLPRRPPIRKANGRRNSPKSPTISPTTLSNTSNCNPPWRAPSAPCRHGIRRWSRCITPTI